MTLTRAGSATDGVNELHVETETEEKPQVKAATGAVYNITSGVPVYLAKAVAGTKRPICPAVP